jgi:2-oxoglutarate ferredoxin oxidoreductase subunit beta
MNQIATVPPPAGVKLTNKDFLSDTAPRWCPGCGSYVILSSLTKTFATLNIPREKYAVISGIGCSSRFPYYTSTFGFHTIHGRAPTVAMGLKMARPDLSVWIVTGDGDSLSIGGNHFMHLMRRNPDIKILLFNNEIYGLTKGQASPTTHLGQTTKSTPFGTIDNPIKPLALAIAAGATFAARVTDGDLPLMGEVLAAAAKHKGIAFVEVLQNCVIFNDGIFDPVTDKTTRPDNTVRLKHGEPMIFGANKQFGVKAEGFKLVKCDAADPGVMKHDAGEESSDLAYALAQLENPAMPVPVGIFRNVDRPTYDERLAARHGGPTVFADVLRGGSAWTVNADGSESKAGRP